MTRFRRVCIREFASGGNVSRSALPCKLQCLLLRRREICGSPEACSNASLVPCIQPWCLETNKRKHSQSSVFHTMQPLLQQRFRTKEDLFRNVDPAPVDPAPQRRSATHHMHSRLQSLTDKELARGGEIYPLSLSC